MMDRRHFLLKAGAVSVAGVGASLLNVKDVQAADFKALVVVFLSGGFDGNNMLVPVDAAYSDYASARPSLALPKDSLVRLQGTHIGHQFGLSPAMSPLAALFAQQRMAVVANVGALVQPTTKTALPNCPPFWARTLSKSSGSRAGWAMKTSAVGADVRWTNCPRRCAAVSP